MNVLLIGSGGREHAIAWKLAQSPQLSQLYTLPGNPGMAQYGINLSGDPLDAQKVLEIAQSHQINLVVVGPEAPLAVGVADELREAGFLVFGPSREGAQLESSKAYAKDFMHEFNIPTGRYQVFDNHITAKAHIKEIEYAYVIKASGLAAGKGVFLPENNGEAEIILHQIMVESRFGDAGEQVVIEERLSGPELSVLAFTDGDRIEIMPPAQDHKRLLDYDQGPNTGGMGVFAPSLHAGPELLQTIEEQILHPTLAGLKERRIDYRGVLYAGLMLTPEGPKLLEYNCRFGDPETQVILPLIESDLLDVLLKTSEGHLPKVFWKEASAACVVLASGGYPESYEKGFLVSGLDVVSEAIVFHAGTKVQGDQVVSNGGRVLGVTATGDSLKAAVQIAYQETEKIFFENMQYRKDIGPSFSAYSEAGVDIEAGNRATELMKKAVEATHGPEVLAGVGSFGGLYDAASITKMNQPVLVSSTDGVGTKVILAAQYGLQASIGHDIVNHCINDILVQGARPLFFMDYFAASKLDPEQVAEIVGGMAVACEGAGCALLGGETAEMPGVYHQGQFDVAGTIVGVVERELILPKETIQAGHVLVGLPSSGPHTNGYTLIRKIFADIDLHHVYSELEKPLGEVLLVPHRSYFNKLWPLLQDHPKWIKGMAHITGGGFIENLPRILPEGITAEVNSQSWEIPPLFELIKKLGNISQQEMYRVFNMGIGMILVTSTESAEDLITALGEGRVIGHLVPGEEVRLVNQG